MNISNFIFDYEQIVLYIAQISVYTLELIGISVIIIGSFKSLSLILSRFRKKKSVNVIIDLARCLSLALEFKMGAEIINTVIIRDLKELGTLAIVILIRALLAVLIHWEINIERKEEKENLKNNYKPQ